MSSIDFRFKYSVKTSGQILDFISQAKKICWLFLNIFEDITALHKNKYGRMRVKRKLLAFVLMSWSDRKIKDKEYLLVWMSRSRCL